MSDEGERATAADVLWAAHVIRAGLNGTVKRSSTRRTHRATADRLERLAHWLYSGETERIAEAEREQEGA